MTEQPTALRLADKLSLLKFSVVGAENALAMEEAAAELRRLSSVETDLLAMRRVFSEAGCTFDVNYIRRLVRAEAQRDALLEALKLARSIIGHPDDAHSQMIDAAIKAVEEGK